jgi:type VI protein secretion system component VasK
VPLVPLIAWIVALAFAAVVLAFCAFEVIWKARRLRADLAGLQALTDRVHGLQHDIVAVQERLARADAG